MLLPNPVLTQCTDYLEYIYLQNHNFPVNIYLFKVNNRNSRKSCEICSKLTIKAPEQPYFTPFSTVSIVDFEQVNVGWVFSYILSKL